MPEISLIIPVYNCEKVLSHSLSSVKAQHFTDFEVILIDDGSTDGSRSICNKFSQEDPRFITIHQPNAGASSARNTGIKQSSGRWIVFMDSDDAIGPDYLAQLYNHKCEHGVTVAGFYERQNNQTKLSVDFGAGYFSKKDGNLYEISKNSLLYSHPSPIAKIFDGDVIRNNDILFDPQVSLCEDLLFWMEYICHADCSLIINPVEYVYLKENSFLTKKIHPFESHQKLVYEFIRLSHKFASNLDRHMSSEACKHAAMLTMNAINAIYAEQHTKKNRINALKKLRQDNSNLIRLHYVGNTPVMKLKKWLYLNCLNIFDIAQSFSNR